MEMTSFGRSRQKQFEQMAHQALKGTDRGPAVSGLQRNGFSIGLFNFADFTFEHLAPPKQTLQ